MKVLHLISSGGYYGAESMVVNLANALSKQHCLSIIGVFYNEHKPHTEIAEAARVQGLQVEPIYCGGRADWNTVRAIRNYIESHKIDIIHTHGYKADFYGYAAGKRLGTPLIATSHNWTGCTAALRLFAFLDHLILKHFHKVVAVSDTVAASLLRFGAHQDKVKTIDNGVDLAAFEAASPTLAKEIEKGERVLVGTVGRLVFEKGFHYYLRAAQEILREFPDTLFVLVGEGPDRKRLEEMARELEINHNLIFTGERNDMPGVYASLDIFVLPSLLEGMPITVLEAMASKKAVVATRVGAVPKVVVQGKTGLLVEPRDTEGLRSAIARLLAEPELRKKLGENGHSRVRQHFSSEIMARRYLDLYQGVLAKMKAA